MKAKDYNGTIKKFINIPKSYGNIMAGFDLLSDEELKTYGFYEISTNLMSSNFHRIWAKSAISGFKKWDAILKS